MAPPNGSYDVVIVGGGNAALSAAITAREAGASVLVLEHAPKAMRGGNSRHTRNLRAMHEAPTSVLTEAYLEDEYWDDLLRVTGGQTDEHLARLTIRATQDALPFMARCGVRFQPSLTGTLNLSRTNAFFLGGGKALMNAFYAHAERLGVSVLYDTQVSEIALDNGFVRKLTVTSKGFPFEVGAKVVIASSGGFQANIAWLKEAWGPAADNFLIRGTPYATGTVLKNLLGQGVASVGDPTQCHAVAIDGRAPKFDGGIATRLDWHSVFRGGQQARPALLRRGRGCLAQALRDLGPAGGATARPGRLQHHRPAQRAPVHAVHLPRHQGGEPRRTGRPSSGSTRPRSRRPSRSSTPPACPAPSTRPGSTACTPTG